MFVCVKNEAMSKSHNQPHGISIAKFSLKTSKITVDFGIFQLNISKNYGNKSKIAQKLRKENHQITELDSTRQNCKQTYTNARTIK